MLVDLYFEKVINCFFNYGCWVIFHALVVCWLFSKSTFPKNSFRNTIRVSNCLDLDHDWRSDIQSILIWVGNVCKAYQQIVNASKYRVNWTPLLFTLLLPLVTNRDFPRLDLGPPSELKKWAKTSPYALYHSQIPTSTFWWNFTKIWTKIAKLQMHENFHKNVNENMFSFTFLCKFSWVFMMGN